MSTPSIEKAAELAAGARHAVALRARVVALRRLAKRRHLRANLVFLVAGLGFGSAIYLARTRFASLVAGGRATRWFLLVGLGVLLFGAASWLHVAALRIDEERAEVEDELGALGAVGPEDDRP